MTLASESKRKTPARPGTTQSKAGRGSVSDTLPPTLLRLPDLDPQSKVEDGAPQPTDDSRDAVPEIADIGSASQATVEVAEPKGLATAHHREAESTNVSPPPVQSTEMPKNERRDTPPVAVAAFERDMSESTWLNHLASRKALLVMLVLIAGLAVFMPRSGGSGGEVVDTQVAALDPVQKKNSEPELNVAAEQIAVEEAIVSAKVSSVEPPAGSMVQQPQNEPQPGDLPHFANTAALATAKLNNPVTAMEPPQPAKNDTAPFDTPVSATTQFDAPNLDAPNFDQVTASLAAQANEAIRRMDAMKNPEIASESETAASEPVRVDSRTPYAITNWADYLPPVDAESFAVGVTVEPTVDTDIDAGLPRTTKLPDEPDFRFALPENVLTPGSTTSNMSSPGGSVPISSPIPPNRPATMQPQARVAMPDDSGIGGIAR